MTMPNPEAMTDPAGAVEQIQRWLGEIDAGHVEDPPTDAIRALLARITELEELVADLTWGAFLAAGGDVP